MPKKFIVSFEIAYSRPGTETYSQIRDKLMERIRAFPKVWEETTSFAIFEGKDSEDDSASILKHLWYGAGMDYERDKMVVIEDLFPSGSVKGPGAEDLQSKHSGIKKI